MDPTRRPGLLTFGIILTAIYASCVLMLLVLAGVVGIGAGGFAMLNASAEALIPVGLALGLGTLVLLGMAIYYFAVLFACWGAWNGSRPWTITLIVFSAVGLINAGPLSVLVGVLTIIGCVQAMSSESSVDAAGA